MTNISAIILAAGKSKRMGQPKMLLPWGRWTILGQVVRVYASAGIGDIVVVTGADRESIEFEVENLATTLPVRAAYNTEYENGEMLSSIHCGLNAIVPGTRAVLIGLGDQPQVEERTLQLVIETYLTTGTPLIVPSYNMRRGHPVLLAHNLWPDLLALKYPHSMRDFLNAHSRLIHYLEISSPSVIQDIDTPEDYERFDQGGQKR